MLSGLSFGGFFLGLLFSGPSRVFPHAGQFRVVLAYSGLIGGFKPNLKNITIVQFKSSQIGWTCNKLINNDKKHVQNEMV